MASSRKATGRKAGATRTRARAAAAKAGRTSRKAPAKAAAKRTTTRKAPARKAPARKAPARKTAKRKAPAKASPRKTATRAAPRKTAAKATPRKAAATRKAAGRASARADVGGTADLVTLAYRLLVRSMSARLAPKAIGYGQYPVLVQLWHEDGLTQKELSNRVRIEAPTMVRTLDRMERERLVIRKRSDTDRRQIHIQLTARGRALKSDLSPLAREIDQLALSGLSKADRDRLAALLGRVIGNMEGDPAAA